MHSLTSNQIFLLGFFRKMPIHYISDYLTIMYVHSFMYSVSKLISPPQMLNPLPSLSLSSFSFPFSPSSRAVGDINQGPSWWEPRAIKGSFFLSLKQVRIQLCTLRLLTAFLTAYFLPSRFIQVPFYFSNFSGYQQ